MVTRDKDNIPYTIQNWYEGRECDTKSREDIIRSVQILARVHKFMNMPVEKAYMARSLADEYARHNQEIRKIRKFYPPERVPVPDLKRNFWAVYSVSGKRGKSTGNACKVGL